MERYRYNKRDFFNLFFDSETIETDKFPIAPETGNCPECGGKLQYDDDVYHIVPSHNCMVEDDRITEYYVYRCEDCGKYYRTKNDVML